MSKFIISKTYIEGLKVIERNQVRDERGFFSRIFCQEQLNIVGWKKPVAQINHSKTKNKGTVRGMHFQNQPHTEMKLVTCIRGAIWDVAIDVRENSVTYLKWHAVKLSSTNCRALLIPEGFAHGYQTLTNNCELVYLHSEPYAKNTEAGINPNDPAINVNWPINNIQISEKDNNFKFIDSQFIGIRI